MTNESLSSSPPVEVVDQFIADINAQDLDSALGRVAEDCYYDNVPIEDMTGRDKMRERLEPTFLIDGNVEFEVLRQTASGNTVMNERVDRFNTRSGRLIELRVLGVFEGNDGLITFWRDYFDNDGYMRQVKGR